MIKGKKQSEEHIRKRIGSRIASGSYEKQRLRMKGNQFGKLLKGKKKPPRSMEHCLNMSKAKKGKLNPMLSKFLKGKKPSENFIIAGKRASLGRIKSFEECKKISESIKGSKHWNWKGGITPERKRLYFSSEYKLWRKSVFERDDYTCVWCGAKSGNGKRNDVHADHIKPWSFFPELRFVIDNGRTLCVECHKKTETYGFKSVKNNHAAMTKAL